MDKENNSIQSFFFQEHEVRFVGTADCPEWIAQDVCAVLGIKNHRDTVAGLEDYQKGVVITDTPGGRQEMLTLKEPGLYEVVMKSRKAQAKEFKRWVFEEVLPSIRKTGSYSAQPKTTAEIILAQAQMLVEVERRLADLEQSKKYRRWRWMRIQQNLSVFATVTAIGTRFWAGASSKGRTNFL